MRKSTYSYEYAALTKRLAQLRQGAGLTQRQLAAALRTPYSVVAKIESGERRIDLVEFAWFCNACKADAVAESGRLLAEWGSSSGSRSLRRQRGRA